MLTVYTASWCSPCKNLKQMLKNNNIEYKEVDIDLNPDQARELGIRGIPTLVFNDKRLVGNVTKDQVLSMLK